MPETFLAKLAVLAVAVMFATTIVVTTPPEPKK
jgi:hypothetical protein